MRHSKILVSSKNQLVLMRYEAEGEVFVIFGKKKLSHGVTTIMLNSMKN